MLMDDGRRLPPFFRLLGKNEAIQIGHTLEDKMVIKLPYGPPITDQSPKLARSQYCNQSPIINIQINKNDTNQTNHQPSSCIVFIHPPQQLLYFEQKELAKDTRSRASERKN